MGRGRGINHKNILHSRILSTQNTLSKVRTDDVKRTGAS